MSREGVEQSLRWPVREEFRGGSAVMLYDPAVDREGRIGAAGDCGLGGFEEGVDVLPMADKTTSGARC